MTSDLAGYIADGTEPQLWDDTVDGVIAALGTLFTVVAERGITASGGPAGNEGAGGNERGTRRRTWLDTFDWRLHKAGLTLEYVAWHRGGELRLSGRGSEAVQPVAAWRTSRPHLLSDLPDGAVTARIGGLITPRALLPVAAITAETRAYRLTNEDGKTVVRLMVEHQRLSGPSRSSTGTARPAGPDGSAHLRLPPRIMLAEVRGYQAEARRAQALIAAAPGVKPAASPPLQDALRALGRSPGDYTNKVEAKITAAMPAGQAAATIALFLLDAAEANVDGVLADTDTEFLHDLRVAVRRTRSALKLFGDALTGHTGTGHSSTGHTGTGHTSTGLTNAELEFFAAEFKWVGDLTTPTRDLDVHLLDFEATAQSLSAAKPDDLEPFREFLQQRRRKEFRALIRGLKSPRFTELITRWRGTLNRILAGTETRGGTRGSSARSGRFEVAATAGFLAAERTRAAFTKVAKRGAAITPDAPAESLHTLRKRCKELRYALEFFAPLHDPAGYAKVVKDLKRLQDCLGEFQDSEVQIGEIRALAVDMLAAADVLTPAVTLLAMGEVTAGLAVRQRAARADFEQRFAAFADADGQRRMAALLRGREGREVRERREAREGRGR
jgi:CHAD domain-containing protein